MSEQPASLADAVDRISIIPVGDLLLVRTVTSPSSVAAFDVVSEMGTVIDDDGNTAHTLLAARPGTVRLTRWLERNGRELGMLWCSEPAYVAFRGGIYIPPGTYVLGERGWRWGL